MFNNSNSNIIGASGSWEKYTVKAGDTLSGIAAKFHTTVEKLKAINGIKDANKIYAGQILNVRGTYTTGGTSSSGTSVNYTTTTYTVVSGDTLSGIAERNGTTVAELQRLNSISNPNLIQVGQVLTIRGGSSSGYSSGDSTITYTVVSGDTLSGIAERNGTTVAELQRLNSISNPNLIQVGQVLTIQGSAYGESTYNPSDNLPLNEEGFFVTENDLRKIGWTNVSSSMLLDLNSCLRRFQINTVNRIRHFISQCSHESGGGVYTREIASGEAYNGRSDLGNIYPGDGPKFKGGGYIQLTGRYNYQQFANYMGDQQIVQQGVNYVASKYPWTSAGFWWHRNNMNALCDEGASVDRITLRVNGGYNGLADRKYWYNRCVQVITATSIEANNPSTNYGTSSSDSKPTAYTYSLPPKPNTSGYDSIFEVISLVRELEDAYVAFSQMLGESEVQMKSSIARECLGYLGKYYLNQNSWKLSVALPKEMFYTFVYKNYPALSSKLSKYIDANRVEVKDSIGGLNDFAHLSVTAYAYLITPLVPKFWTGWGGDLATGMADVHNYMSKHSHLSLKKVSDAVIGAHESAPSTYIKLDNGVNCNYTDLCDDADAIGITRLLRTKRPSTHILSETMIKYYSNLTKKERYMQYQNDGLDYSDLNTLSNSIYKKMTGAFERISFGLLNLTGGANEAEQWQACLSFANYLLHCIK